MLVSYKDFKHTSCLYKQTLGERAAFKQHDNRNKMQHSNSEKTKTILLRGTKKEQCVTNLFVCKVTPRLSSNADVDTDGWRHRDAALVPVILVKIAAGVRVHLLHFLCKVSAYEPAWFSCPPPQQAGTTYTIKSIIITFSVYNILLGDTVTY